MTVRTVRKVIKGIIIYLRVERFPNAYGINNINSGILLLRDSSLINQINILPSPITSLLWDKQQLILCGVKIIYYKWQQCTQKRTGL